MNLCRTNARWRSEDLEPSDAGKPEEGAELESEIILEMVKKRRAQYEREETSTWRWNERNSRDDGW
jgi:hypothetical protein